MADKILETETGSKFVSGVGEQVKIGTALTENIKDLEEKMGELDKMQKRLDELDLKRRGKST